MPSEVLEPTSDQERVDLLSKLEAFSDQLRNASKRTSVDVYEKKLKIMADREEDLQQQLNNAQTIQIQLARRLIADMQQVRDEWAQALAEKDVEVKTKD